ncbi:hypothetical protein C1H76_6117 [Elsinoe australis]|uniref:Uncharacterized protein n=1 Tax=Elsinoe australis TaxID=40998 RepID=A0A4U7AXP6_9PEZI|nr:hypothetical protein C1H76_6117 [Elsinoe australis]
MDAIQTLDVNVPNSSKPSWRPSKDYGHPGAPSPPHLQAPHAINCSSVISDMLNRLHYVDTGLSITSSLRKRILDFIDKAPKVDSGSKASVQRLEAAELPLQDIASHMDEGIDTLPRQADVDDLLRSQSESTLYPHANPEVRDTFLDFTSKLYTTFGRPKNLQVCPSGSFNAPMIIHANYAPMESSERDFGTSSEPTNPTMTSIRSKLLLEPLHSAMSADIMWIENYYERCAVPKQSAVWRKQEQDTQPISRGEP